MEYLQNRIRISIKSVTEVKEILLCLCMHSGILYCGPNLIYKRCLGRKRRLVRQRVSWWRGEAGQKGYRGSCLDRTLGLVALG